MSNSPVDVRPRVPLDAPMRSVMPVTRVRVLAGIGAVTVVVVAMAMNAQALPDHGVIPAFVALVLGALAAPLAGSVVEWLVHRGIAHSPRRWATMQRAHAAHHEAHSPPWRFVVAGMPRVVVSSAGLLYAVAGVLAMVPAWWLSRRWWFVAGAGCSAVAYAALALVVHRRIHHAGANGVIEHQRWFAALDRHHFVHHVDAGSNLNVLLPLADLLFGTVRTEVSMSELAGRPERTGASKLG